MKPLFKISLAASLFLTASAAVADVTAADVWAQTQEWFEANGAGTMSYGAVLENGAEITVSDIALNFETPEVTVSIDYGTISFVENGDGTVSVTYADVIPAKIVDTAEESLGVSFEMRSEGQSVLVSGEPENMTYDMSTAKTSVVLTELNVADDDVTGTAELVIMGMAAKYSLASGDLMDMSYDARIDSIAIDATFQSEGDGENVIFTGMLNAVTGDGTAMIPMGIDYSDPAVNPFAQGMVFDGGYGYESGQYSFSMTDNGSQNGAEVSYGASDLRMSADSAKVAFSAGVKNLATTIMGPIPVPLEFGASEIAMSIAMPLGKELADYEMGLRLVDVSVSDFIWSMVDPLEKLGRDPITAIVNMTGEGKWFFDLTDPEQAAAMERADVPGEVNSLNLNELRVEAAGASLIGDGAFVFDNNDLQTIPGMPRPEGKLELTLSGGNALMDTLVEMGLLSMDDVMPIRMMSGMFAEVVGDDVLKSVIEVNSDGHVSANGQRLR